MKLRKKNKIGKFFEKRINRKWILYPQTFVWIALYSSLFLGFPISQELSEILFTLYIVSSVLLVLSVLLIMFND